MKKVLALKIFDATSLLPRICAHLWTRGINIESLALGPADTVGFSVLSLVINGDKHIVEQLPRVLSNVVAITEVKDLSNIASIEKELMLIKIYDSLLSSKIVTQYMNSFDGINNYNLKILHRGDNAMTLQVVGNSQEINKILDLLKDCIIIDVIRTGIISMQVGIY
jgi:acetolactate synthase I/III small subunit